MFKALAAILLWLSCITAQAGIAAASQEAVVPGVIDFGDERTNGVLVAPSSVEVRENFRIIINTFGGGCESKGHTSVILSAQGATLLVYNITVATRPDVICTAVVKRIPHTAMLRFDKPGEALIRIWGRRVGAETPPLGMPFVLEHRVLVK